MIYYMPFCFCIVAIVLGLLMKRYIITVSSITFLPASAFFIFLNQGVFEKLGTIFLVFWILVSIFFMAVGLHLLYQHYKMHW